MLMRDRPVEGGAARRGVRFHGVGVGAGVAPLCRFRKDRKSVV